MTEAFQWVVTGFIEVLVALPCAVVILSIARRWRSRPLVSYLAIVLFYSLAYAFLNHLARHISVPILRPVRDGVSIGATGILFIILGAEVFGLPRKSVSTRE